MRATFVKLGMGTFVAQMSNLVFLPVIIGIYPPELYGKYLLVIYGCNLILPFVVLKFDTKIITSESKEFLNLAKLYFVLTELILILGASLIFFLRVILNSAPIAGTLLLLELVLLFAILQSLVIYSNSLALSMKLVSNVAISSVLQNLLTAIFQIIFGLLLSNVYSLFLGFALGRLVALIPNSKVIFTIFHFNNFFNADLKSRIRLWIEVRVIVSGLIDAVAVAFPVFFTYIFISSSQAGALGLAQSILSAPVTLIGGSLISAILVEKRGRGVDDKSNRNYVKIHSRLIILGAAIAISELLFAYSSFGGLLGENWAATKNIFVILIFPFFIFFSTSTFFGRLLVEDKWEVYAKINSMALVGGIGFSITSIFLTQNWLWQATSFSLGRSIFLIIALSTREYLLTKKKRS